MLISWTHSRRTTNTMGHISAWDAEEDALMAVEKELHGKGVFALVARYGSSLAKVYKTAASGVVRPSLRVQLHSLLTEKEVTQVVNAIRDASKKIRV